MNLQEEAGDRNLHPRKQIKKSFADELPLRVVRSSLTEDLEEEVLDQTKNGLEKRK